MAWAAATCTGEAPTVVHVFLDRSEPVQIRCGATSVNLTADEAFALIDDLRNALRANAEHHADRLSAETLTRSQ